VVCGKSDGLRFLSSLENTMKIVGIVLIAIGLLGAVYGGISFTRKDKVIDAGPIEITRDKTERLPITPIASGLVMVAGVVLLLRSGRAV